MPSAANLEQEYQNHNYGHHDDYEDESVVVELLLGSEFAQELGMREDPFGWRLVRRFFHLHYMLAKNLVVVVAEVGMVFTDIPATSRCSEIVAILKERTERNCVLYHLGQRLAKN